MQAQSKFINLDASSNNTPKDNANISKGISSGNAPRRIIAIKNNSTFALTDSTSNKYGDTPIRQK